MGNPVLENKRALEAIYAKVWTLYRKIPGKHRKKAQKLIDEWHYSRISYEKLLKELRKLARS